MCLIEFSETTQKGPWKVAKNVCKHIPLLKMQQHETLGTGFKQEQVKLKTLIFLKLQYSK